MRSPIPIPIKSGVVLIATLFLAAACASTSDNSPDTNNPASPPSDDPYAAIEPEMRKTYPTLEALYVGDQGLYRGCGPNNGVCHNSREFPNLSTLGSLIENINLPCNEKREDATQVHDLCERKGDLLRAGSKGPGVEIAWVERDPSGAERTFRLHLREPITPKRELTIVRPPKVEGDTEVELAYLNELGAKVTVDPTDPKIVVVVTPDMSKPAPGEEEADPDLLTPMFEKAGRPGDPLAVQVGDPNRNGTFGAELNGRIIAAGDPERSYIFKRLTDQSAGPIMPRANCCFWTKASLRALWCWVAGLTPDGSNALDAINYDACPPGPPDTMEYPTPGPSCETSGMCPLQPKLAITAETPATWTNVYTGILKPNCTSCHAGVASAAGLDMATKETALANVMKRVVPGDANASVLYQRLTPDLCNSGCNVMPKGSPPLSPVMRGLVESWIRNGARED